MPIAQKMNVRFAVLAVMILFAAFSRLIPHMPNFSPLGTIGLFGAAYFLKKWQAFLIPIAATWLSDLFINNVIYAQYFPKFTWFYKGFYWQYGSYLMIVLAGLWIMKKVTVPRIIGGALASSAIFFLISNFGVWLGSRFYPQDTAGLLQCYTAALPFLKGTLYGNLFYAGVLFGGFAYAQKQFPALRPVHAHG
ncbi:DUF6580 family putative transport protein [Sediminibacterium sp.]|uniref:DUF6580 family putative transport protein n=1 Tax=Sediminibacterium sp. TaxID=1917865 RepID=UPI0027316F0E|nr:DUF6580 family putative transport protein [Sediminibacterium sp.]MDP2421481.1 hypothetical protein [Sediminibacterium sp.]